MADAQFDDNADPRPLLSIAFANEEQRPTIPAVLKDAPGAHHRYEILREFDPGVDRTDVSVLWVPTIPDPLTWLGILHARVSLRTDGQVIVVLSKTRGKTAAELDQLEKKIRERFVDLGMPGDEYLIVRETRSAAKKDGTPGWSSVIDAINSFAKPKNTGFDGPLLATSYSWVQPNDPALGGNPKGSPFSVINHLGPMQNGQVVKVLSQKPQICTITALRERVNFAPPRAHLDIATRFSEIWVGFEPTPQAYPSTLITTTDTRVASKVRIKMSFPFSNTRRFQKKLPAKRANLSAYFPCLGNPMPVKLVEATPAEDGFTAILNCAPTPIFEGMWAFVDHASLILHTGSLIEVLE